MNRTVRTRIAPSPTGEIHIGSLRTALYSWALARQNKGQFIVRIEDTDQKRLVAGATDRILKDLKDCGLNWDEGPFKQSDRLDIYQKYIKELLDKNLAYYCFCSQERLDGIREVQKKNKQVPKYDRHCINLSKEDIETKIKAGESYVIRMRMPDNQIVEFTDLVRGLIKINTNDLDDQVLIKSNGIPTYHFAVVIDDHLMNISHVLRGDEWLTSTPKQVLLYKFFNWEMPVFCHLTVLLDPSHPGKMSKRHGSVFTRQFLDDGYLPEALMNFLMLLGWNPGTNQEVFSLEEFVKEFSLEKLHKKAPVFDRKKLDYFNSIYIRAKSDQEFFELVKPFFEKDLGQIDLNKLKILAPLLRERTVTLRQAVDMGRFVFDEEANYDFYGINQKVKDKKLTIMMVGKMIEVLKLVDFSDVDSIQAKLLNLCDQDKYNRGDFFMALRMAVSGKGVTPPIVDCMPLLGKEKCIERLTKFSELLEESE